MSPESRAKGSFSENVTFHFVVGGTGISMNALPPRTTREPYEVLTVPGTDDQFLDRLLLGIIPPSFLQTWMVSAAVKFRSLNGGLQFTKHQTLWNLLSTMLRMYYCEEKVGYIGGLTSRYGLLIETGRWYEWDTLSDKPKNVQAPSSLQVMEKIEDQDATFAFCRLTTEEYYAMPPSSIAILSLLLWDDVPLMSSRSSLPNATQYAMTLLVMACRRESELLHLLKFNQCTDRAFRDLLLYKAPVKILLWNSFVASTTAKCAVLLCNDRKCASDVVVRFGSLALLIHCQCGSDAATSAAKFVCEERMEAQLRSAGVRDIRYVTVRWSKEEDSPLSGALFGGQGISLPLRNMKCLCSW